MDISSAVQLVKLGRAICFLGAGFSRGANDALGRPLFGVEELRSELFELAGLPNDNSELSDIANYCQKKDQSTAEKLRLMILDRFTLAKPSEDQIEILNQPWRSAFTVNYDDIPEQIWAGEYIQIFSPIDPDKVLLPQRRLFYLHGRGRDVQNPDVDAMLVLSSRDYANIGKAHQKLRDYFSNEMATSEAIIFIGYSARDLDFTRQLAVLGGSIKYRTLFVEAPDIRPIDRARIEDYGQIAAIGTKGFAEALRDTQIPEVLRTRPKLIREISLDDESRQKPTPATDTEIHRQLLTGELDARAYSAQRQSTAPTAPSLIERKGKIGRIFKLLAAGNNRIIVTADIGNGKTFFLRQVEQSGLDEGYRVFRIDGTGPEYSAEVERLFSESGKKLFIVDDAIRYRHLLQLIGRRLTSDCGLVIGNSNNFERIGIYDLREVLGGQIFEVDINVLDSDEINDWVTFLNRWGLWGEYARYSEKEKREYLIDQCSAENRSIIIGLYRHSQLASKIANIIDHFLSDSTDKNKLYAFIGSIISSLVDKHVMWKNVVDWLDINEGKFIKSINNSDVSSLLNYKNGEFMLPSAQLARFFLDGNRFMSVNPDDISEVYVSIVLGTSRQMSDTRYKSFARENLKELMRFRILSILFGSNEDSLKLISHIYNRLAADRHIQSKDQFWLQFAMARLAANDLSIAEIYLKNALGIARGQGQDWDTKQIEDQFARLWLRKAIENDIPNASELENALKNLSKTLDKIGSEQIYALRSAKYIEPLLEKHISNLDEKLRDSFLNLLSAMWDIIKTTRRLPGSEKGETDVLRKHIQRARLVIQNA